MLRRYGQLLYTCRMLSRTAQGQLKGIYLDVSTPRAARTAAALLHRIATDTAVVASLFYVWIWALCERPVTDPRTGAQIHRRSRVDRI